MDREEQHRDHVFCAAEQAILCFARHVPWEDETRGRYCAGQTFRRMCSMLDFDPPDGWRSEHSSIEPRQWMPVCCLIGGERPLLVCPRVKPVRSMRVPRFTYSLINRIRTKEKSVPVSGRTQSLDADIRLMEKGRHHRRGPNRGWRFEDAWTRKDYHLGLGSRTRLLAVPPLVQAAFHRSAAPRFTSCTSRSRKSMTHRSWPCSLPFQWGRPLPPGACLRHWHAALMLLSDFMS
jgi:hypothetical protein